MLMLLVRAGIPAYAIKTTHIIEIVPKVDIQAMSQAPGFLLGHIKYSGRPIPVVDLTMLIEGASSANSMHTRIVLLASEENPQITLGLIAEKVTETADLPEQEFITSGLNPKDLPFFSGVLCKGNTTIQLIDIDKLFIYLRLSAPPSS